MRSKRHLHGRRKPSAAARSVGKLIGASLLFATLTLAACARPAPGETQDAVNSMASARGEATTDEVAAGEIDRSVQVILAGEIGREDAVRVALLNNPGLLATFEELGIAEAELRQAGILPNPTLFASRRTPRFGDEGTNYEFELTQEVLDLLVMPLRRRVEAARLERIKLHVADEIMKQAAETRSAFLALQGRMETLEMRRKVAETTGAAAELARRQREAGNLSRLREAQHRALHEEAILELARAEADVVAQREALNRLMGVWGESTHWRVVNERLTRLPGEEPSLMDLESLAVGQRLDLAAARAEVDAVTRALELTRRWRFLGGLSFGYNSEREADGQYLLGPNLEIDLPLFDRKQARIQALEAQRRRADQRLRSLAIDIRSEVREARAGLLVARETARYYETAVLPTRETIVEQMQLFQSGMLESTYELLQVKREQIDSMQAAIEAREAYWQARVTLEKALGGRLDDAWPAPDPAGGASAARMDDKPQMDGAGHGAHGGK